jgi:hypothetical protein
MPEREIARRSFIAASLAGAASTALGLRADEPKGRDPSLADEIGITTGSFSQFMATEKESGKLVLMDLPLIMRDEMEMRVIDLMTRNVPSLEPDYLDRFRTEAERRGCIITNLKMNQDVDMAAADREVRKQALDEYRRTIDAAQRLGCRWVRPVPRGKKQLDLKPIAAGFRELIDYATPKGISLLVENNAWISDDPDVIPDLIKTVGPGLSAAPDTGNWTDRARYPGLERAFPLAVTCDFKAKEFDAEGQHPQYDLKRCFEIGWQAGFRGPWCLEHSSKSLDETWRNMIRVRDMLRAWMKAEK